MLHNFVLHVVVYYTVVSYLLTGLIWLCNIEK